MNRSNQTPNQLFLKALVAGGVLSLLHILLERCMAFSVSDVALYGLTKPLDIAIVLCHAAFFFILYALVFASLEKFGRASSYAILLLPVALAIFKYIGNWGAYLVTENVTMALMLRLSFVNALGFITIELVQYALVLAALFFGRKQAPSRRLLFVCGVMLVINLLSRLLGDIEYGAPASARELGLMLAYYSFDIFLYGPVAYLCMNFIIKTQHKKDPTA